MRKAKIYYARMDEFWRREQKLSCLENFESLQDVDWQEIQPDKKYVWLTEGFEDDFDSFIALGSKEAKAHHENHLLRHKIAKLEESLRLARIMIQSQAETRWRFERTVLQVLMLCKNLQI